MALASRQRAAADKNAASTEGTSTKKTKAEEAKEVKAQKAAEKAIAVAKEEVKEQKAAATKLAKKETEKEVAETPAEVPPETTAVAVKKQTLPGTQTKLVLALDSCKDVIEPCEFGMLPRVTASQGALICDGEELGKQIEITIMSYNESFAVAPNESEAPKELCKFSYDNVVLNDGSGITVDEHLNYLRGEGYKNAASKQYFEIIAMLDDAEEDHDEIGSVVQLSLSPQSVKQFNRYKLNTAMKIRSGAYTEEDAKKVTVTAKTKTFAYTFTMMRFAITTD